MLTGCREYRPRLIELARGAVDANERRVLLAHVEGCAECARILEGQSALSTALDGVAGEPLPEMAAIEARVMAEFDRAIARRVSRWALVAGIAAALVLGVVLLERRSPVERPQPRVTTAAAPVILPSPAISTHSTATVQRVQQKVNRRRATDENQPFVTIPYTVPLGPEERTTVVRMEIPVAWLISVGFDVGDLDPGGVVVGDVLVSQDGRARAIRLLSITK